MSFCNFAKALMQEAISEYIAKRIVPDMRITLDSLSEYLSGDGDTADSLDILATGTRTDDPTETIQKDLKYILNVDNGFVSLLTWTRKYKLDASEAGPDTDLFTLSMAPKFLAMAHNFHKAHVCWSHCTTT